MKALILSAVILGVAAGTGTAQDRTLTPGVVRPLDQSTICLTKWGHDRRMVTVSMKQHVAAAYGVAWGARQQFEFDHLVPRSLGGADDVRNLWPEVWPEAHRKDRLEVALHKAVCAGTLPLEAAQAMFQGDWRASYRAWFHEAID